MSWSFEFVAATVEDAKAHAEKLGESEHMLPGVRSALLALERFGHADGAIISVASNGHVGAGWCSNRTEVKHVTIANAAIAPAQE